MQLLSPQDWPQYQLIDSGDFEKLERFGKIVTIRPEPKALWAKSLSDEQWRARAHVRFAPGAGFARAGKEDSGTWETLKSMPEPWFIDYVRPAFRFKLRLGLTAFKHVGVFPEQAPNWDYIYQRLCAFSSRPASNGPSSRPKVLNLFAYTGAASLAACAAGAQVVHIDAVKQVMTWAKENMGLSNMQGIRWIMEDALRFVRREIRRGNLYDGIILDPPAYGHGPGGERWKLDECLFTLLCSCNKILSRQNSFLLLNLYSNGYSAVLADSLVREAWGRQGKTTFGELYLRDSFEKCLPLSVFVRLEL